MFPNHFSCFLFRLCCFNTSLGLVHTIYCCHYSFHANEIDSKHIKIFKRLTTILKFRYSPDHSHKCNINKYVRAGKRNNKWQHPFLRMEFFPFFSWLDYSGSLFGTAVFSVRVFFRLFCHFQVVNMRSILCPRPILYYEKYKSCAAAGSLDR